MKPGDIYLLSARLSREQTRWALNRTIVKLCKGEAIADLVTFEEVKIAALSNYPVKIYFCNPKSKWVLVSRIPDDGEDKEMYGWVPKRLLHKNTKRTDD
jgi:hypothetical protein